MKRTHSLVSSVSSRRCGAPFALAPTRGGDDDRSETNGLLQALETARLNNLFLINFGSTSTLDRVCTADSPSAMSAALPRGLALAICVVFVLHAPANSAEPRKVPPPLQKGPTVFLSVMFGRVLDSQTPPSSQVDLRDVAALTFRRGKMTASRRVSPIPQVGTAARVPATLAAI